MFRAMILEPGMKAELMYICPLEIDELVGGRPRFSEPCRGICVAENSEAEADGLKQICVFTDRDGNTLAAYAGTVVILGLEDGAFRSLTDRQAIRLLEMFGEFETVEIPVWYRREDDLEDELPDPPADEEEW